MKTQIRNVTRNTLIAADAEVARSFWARGRGLMGRTALPEGYGLIIYPEWSIHMLFMRIPLDVLFIDREQQVIGLHEGLPPWSLYAGVSPFRGHYVIELPIGAIAASDTRMGDRIAVEPPL